MNKVVSIFNKFHLGDCLQTAHLLRSLAKRHPDREFWFFLNGNIIAQINEVVEDIQNISLFTFESEQWNQQKHVAVDGWKNHGGTDTSQPYSGPYQQGHWEKSKHRWDWVQHTLEHHAFIAKKMGLKSTFDRPEHLLLDYPALGPSVQEIDKPWSSEVLVINSDPQSGQIPQMTQGNSGYLDNLIWRLGQNHSVLTTQPSRGALCTQSMGHSVSMIGRLSVWCQHHVCVATGPLWPTLNVHNNHLWNPNRKRIVILNNGESLRGIPWIEQVSRVEEAEDILRGSNLI